MTYETYHAATLARFNRSKPAKSRYVTGNGKPGMKFDGDRFAALCEQWDIDPAEAALEILKNRERMAELKTKEALDVFIKLMEYAYAKKRAVEHSGNLTIGLPELLAEVEEEWQSQKSQPS